MSCTSPGNCTAVGNDNNNAPIYASETAGVWDSSATELSAANGGVFWGMSLYVDRELHRCGK